MTEKEKTNNKILVVIVLYEVELKKTPSFELLHKLVYESKNDEFFIHHIFVYDNSKKFNCPSELVDVNKFTYVHDCKNGGTAAAYTKAYDVCKKVDADWILLLDQDTIIPKNYFEEINVNLKKTKNTNVGAFVPYVNDENVNISPAQVDCFGSFIPIKNFIKNNTNKKITAISSGALINKNSFDLFLPFPNELWLDYVDHWIFLCINNNNKIIIIINCHFSHNLSINNTKKISSQRLESILNGELFFYKKLGSVSSAIYGMRLLKRFFKYIFQDKNLALVILRHLFKKKIFAKKG